MTGQKPKGGPSPKEEGLNTSSALQSWNCNSLVWSIRDGLSSLTGEERLSLNALKDTDQPINGDQLGVELVTGALYVKTDEFPTEDSKKFVNSGDLWAYEEANPRGSTWSRNLDFRQGRKNNSIAPRDGFVSNDLIVLTGPVLTDGIGALISRDGINYNNISTGTFVCRGPAVGYGFMIIVGETASTSYMCKKSTDNAETFSNITLPTGSLPTGVATDGRNVVISSLNTLGIKALYSNNQGDSFSASTISDFSFLGVVEVGGNFVVYTVDGGQSTRIHYSTNGGQTFSPSTLSGNSGMFYSSITVHRGDVYLTSNGSGTHNRVIRSQDRGETFTGIDIGENVLLTSSCSVGEYIYVGGAGGRVFRSRTGDQGDWEEVASPVSNPISLLRGGYVNNTPVLLLGTVTDGERLLTSI